MNSGLLAFGRSSAFADESEKPTASAQADDRRPVLFRPPLGANSFACLPAPRHKWAAPQGLCTFPPRHSYTHAFASAQLPSAAKLIAPLRPE
jgi:hypothetical protein